MTPVTDALLAGGIFAAGKENKGTGKGAARIRDHLKTRAANAVCVTQIYFNAACRWYFLALLALSPL